MVSPYSFLELGEFQVHHILGITVPFVLFNLYFLTEHCCSTYILFASYGESDVSICVSRLIFYSQNIMWKVCSDETFCKEIYFSVMTRVVSYSISSVKQEA